MTIAARDTISAKEAEVYATIDGRVEKLAYVVDFEATVEKNKAEIRSLGRRMVGHKTTSLKGSGKMTIHAVTSKFRTMMQNYVKTGQDVYFDMTVIIDDPASAAGRQTVKLSGVNIDSTNLVKAADDDSVAQSEINFTFEDFEISESHRL